MQDLEGAHATHMVCDLGEGHYAGRDEPERGTRLGGGAVRGCVGGCGSMSRGCVQVDVQVQVCGQCL